MWSAAEAGSDVCLLISLLVWSRLQATDISRELSEGPLLALGYLPDPIQTALDTADDGPLI